MIQDHYPASALHDYPGGPAAWVRAMSAKATREGALVTPKYAASAHGRRRDEVVYGEQGKNAKECRCGANARLSEHEEQALVVARAEALAPSVPELRMLFAIPNGGSRSKATAGRLKAEGVRPGVSDIFLSVPKGCYHGLYIEMKAISGRASDEQKKWIAAAREYGYRAEVCFGADSAWAVICEYLGLSQTCGA